MKIPVKTASLLAAVFCWLLLSALTVFIFWTVSDRARLARDTENERLFNILFTELRNYDDFGSAIENSPTLKARISGFAVYGYNLNLLYSWGKVPASFDEDLLHNQMIQGKFGRFTIPDKQGDSVKFVMRADGLADPMVPPVQQPLPPPPETEGGQADTAGTPDDGSPGGRTEGGRQQFEGRVFRQVQEQARTVITRPGFPFFNILARGRYYYIDISHPAYRWTITITTILFPVCALALLAAALYIRRLYLKNREYRERIESQKNLVVLGTAASTLAHEIKNPLLSIRLQTGILRRTFSGSGDEELTIIEEEVDRLSDLTYRVNDYLREAAGSPQALDVYKLLAETGRRLCGRDMVDEASVKDALILADPDRFRSVFENVIRNALEAGGPPGEIRAALTRSGGTGGPAQIIITIADRGRGINDADRQRVFDPFFTQKSAGTGIGLSISKRFVEAAGGKIELENREGGGVLTSITVKEYVSDNKQEAAP